MLPSRSRLASCASRQVVNASGPSARVKITGGAVPSQDGGNPAAAGEGEVRRWRWPHQRSPRPQVRRLLEAVRLHNLGDVLAVDEHLGDGGAVDVDRVRDYRDGAAVQQFGQALSGAVAAGLAELRGINPAKTIRTPPE